MRKLSRITTFTLLCSLSTMVYSAQTGSQLIEQLQSFRAKTLPIKRTEGQPTALTQPPPQNTQDAAERQSQLDKIRAEQQKALSNAAAQPSEKSLQSLAREQVPSAEGDPIDELAFRDMVKDVFPLSPEQIHRIRKKHDRTQFAIAQPANTPPKPTATSQMVNLSPGSTPPVIRLSLGFVSSLVFLDSTGADWPIEAYDLGNPNAFDIQWDKKSSTLMVQAKEPYTYGNLAVRLRNLTTPVMLTLVPGQKAVDYRVDLRIQGYGPNAAAIPEVQHIPGSTSTILLSVLDGVPPPDSKILRVSGGDVEAWAKEKMMYVRTRLNVISPGWIATMSSADGMHVYKMQKAPRILVSDHGKIVRLQVKGL